MKKNSIALVVVAALAVAYPAASWMTGKRLEEKLSKLEKKDVLFSNFKVVKQSYTRGIFSSKQESTIELDVAGMSPALASPAMSQSLQDTATTTPGQDGTEAKPEPDISSPIKKPLQIQIINYIQHGPVPGIVGVAAGKIETELVLDASTLAEIKKVFGDKKFVEIRTLLNYRGGGSFAITSPAVKTSVGVSQDKLDWKGLRFEIGFDAAYKKLNFNFNSPGLEINAANGGITAKVGEIKMQGDAERAYPDGFIYLGTSKATINSFSFTNAQAQNKGINLKDISLESLTSIKNDLLNAGLKFGIANIMMNDTNIGNFHYDYSLQRLHAPSANQFFVLLREMDLHQKDAAAAVEMQKKLKELGIEILKHDPVVALDRLSLASKNGEFKAAAKFGFVGVQAEDFEVPTALLSKMEVSGQASLTGNLADDFIDASQTDPEARAMMRSLFYSQIDAWETQGYIKRDDKVSRADFSWKLGQMLVNGKPFPAAPNLGAAEAAPVERK